MESSMQPKISTSGQILTMYCIAWKRIVVSCVTKLRFNRVLTLTWTVLLVSSTLSTSLDSISHLHSLSSTQVTMSRSLERTSNKSRVSWDLTVKALPGMSFPENFSTQEKHFRKSLLALMACQPSALVSPATSPMLQEMLRSRTSLLTVINMCQYSVSTLVSLSRLRWPILTAKIL